MATNTLASRHRSMIGVSFSAIEGLESGADWVGRDAEPNHSAVAARGLLIGLGLALGLWLLIIAAVVRAF